MECDLNTTFDADDDYSKSSVKASSSNDFDLDLGHLPRLIHRLLVNFDIYVESLGSDSGVAQANVDKIVFRQKRYTPRVLKN